MLHFAASQNIIVTSPIPVQSVLRVLHLQRFQALSDIEFADHLCNIQTDCHPGDPSGIVARYEMSWWNDEGKFPYCETLPLAEVRRLVSGHIRISVS